MVTIYHPDPKSKGINAIMYISTTAQPYGSSNLSFQISPAFVTYIGYIICTLTNLIFSSEVQPSFLGLQLQKYQSFVGYTINYVMTR